MKAILLDLLIADPCLGLLLGGAQLCLKFYQ